MSTYRPKLAASLALLVAVLAVAACAVLLPPESADAAGSGKRQFTFGPVYVAVGQIIDFTYTNTSFRPTPPVSVVFSNALTGAELYSEVLPSAPVGHGYESGLSALAGTYVRAVVTFDRPAAGQGLPVPFPGTLLLFDGAKVQTVLAPAR